MTGRHKGTAVIRLALPLETALAIMREFPGITWPTIVSTLWDHWKCQANVSEMSGNSTEVGYTESEGVSYG